VNGRRPSSCNGDVSDQSTFVGLSNNRVLILNGGCDDDTLSYAHMYDVENDSWTEISLGIKRRVPSATLLPNGQVILVSGEPVNVDQNLYESSDAGGDPRYVQILDPETKSVFTETSRGSIFRGYHNMIAVNKDGSILVGGGYNQKVRMFCSFDLCLKSMFFFKKKGRCWMRRTDPASVSSFIHFCKSNPSCF
jgi:hypothetical protein